MAHQLNSDPTMARTVRDAKLEVAILMARREELDLSLEAVDDLAGTPDRYEKDRLRW